MKLVLYVWRQAGPQHPGRLVRYDASDVSPDMSFLEMLDVLNDGLLERGEDPVAFDSDCREGICGTCGFMVNGVAHGRASTTVCQLHMRHFRDGQVLFLEPWRSRAFPIVKDLMVDRSALDRIVRAGGYITAPTGRAQDGNTILVPKETSDRALDAASCIGCGACVAACPNGSASLYTGAKMSHLGLLPQGQPERWTRAQRMAAQMDREGFGGCSGLGECEAVCPKNIRLEVIARMSRDLTRAVLTASELPDESRDECDGDLPP